MGLVIFFLPFKAFLNFPFFLQLSNFKVLIKGKTEKWGSGGAQGNRNKASLKELSCKVASPL
jgi:hypothetical protein